MAAGGKRPPTATILWRGAAATVTPAREAGHGNGAAAGGPPRRRFRGKGLAMRCQPSHSGGATGAPRGHWRR